MTFPPIKVVSFDLWDTVFIDDSDEPQREARGLAPKPVQRRNLVQEFLERHEPISREFIGLAYNTTDAAFRQVWYDQSVTWSVSERLRVLLKGLGRELPDAEFAELVRLHEDMELDPKPELVPGVREALELLHGNYKIAIISDTIFSPGRALREILRSYDLLHFFDVHVFSDEVGRSKPHRLMFETVAREAGVELNEIVHIGDRPAKDIDGAHAVGARGILLPIAIDRGDPNHTADAVCDDYRELPEILEKLNQNSKG